MPHVGLAEWKRSRGPRSAFGTPPIGVPISMDGQQDLTGTQPGSDTGAPPEAGTAPASTPPAGRTYTEEDLNRAAAAIRREEQKRVSTLEAEVAGFRKAEEERQQASLTEAERTAQRIKQLEAEAAEATARAAAESAERVRATFIAEHAADLPRAYRMLVTGADEDALKASLEAARGEWETEKSKLTPAPPTPPSIGAPSAAPGAQPQAPQPWGPENMTTEAWRKERVRLGIGVIGRQGS